jgi:UDP-N-acetyl-D-mannosaminuronate dehydrogenase
MSPVAERLLERIQNGQARVGVVGLGYVGLPLAVEFARNGLTCTGIDERKILTEHSAFDYDALAATAPLVVDTRNAIKQTHPHVFKLGAPQPAHAATYRPAGASDRAA